MPDSQTVLSGSVVFPASDYGNPDPGNPRCDEKRPPVIGRIIGNNVQGSDVIITIGVVWFNLEERM